MVLPCTKKEMVFSGIALGVVTGAGIATWKFVDAWQRETALGPVRDLCCRFSAPVANCTLDPKAYCIKLKSEIDSLDTVLVVLFFTSMIILFATLASLGYLMYSSYKAGGRVYRLVQNYRLKAGYQPLAEQAENPPL